MSGFSVDLAALSEARAGVQRLLRGLTADERLGSDPPESVFGHDELAGAAKDFQDRWRDGIAELVAAGASIQRRLAATITGYRRLDEDGAETFQQMGEPG